MTRLSTAAFSFTPSRPMPLAGYVRRTADYDRVDGELEAIFILLSDRQGGSIVIGSVDTLFLTQRSLSDVRAALGETATPVILFATHTHNAPSLAPDLPLLGRLDPVWYWRFVSLCAGAIRTLIDNQDSGEPVAACSGRQRTQLTVNRRLPSWVVDYPVLLREHRLNCEWRIALAENRDGFADPWLRAIFLENERGELRAVIWSLAAHPARYPASTHVSPDFPGLVRAALRQRFGPDCAVVFLPGLAGSAIPRMPRHVPADWKQACLWMLPFYPLSLPVDTYTYQGWVNRVTAAVFQTYETRSRPAEESCIAVARADVPDIFRSDANNSDIALQIARLSLAQDVDILAFNGEMLGEWMPLLDSVAPSHVLYSGYAAGPALYVPTSQQIPEGGYEVLGFQKGFGLAGAFNPDITRDVLSATRRLCQVDR
jgi:neutral ceramidase